jgi:hypothetical protein
MRLLQIIKHKWQRRLFRIIIGFAILILVYKSIFLPRLLSFGASKEEFDMILPGDEVVQSKDYKNTLAITVNKPPSAVWPWIAQMGLNKGGFYSYTLLENMFGCKLYNADRIHPEWQNPKPGDYEGVCQSAVNKNMPGWIVAIVQPSKSFVWKGQEGEWMMGLYIDSINSHSSRLLTRMLYKSPEKFSISWWMEKCWFEWAHCVMQNGMINGIKERAERRG